MCNFLSCIKLLGIFKAETSPVLEDDSEYELVYPTTPLIDSIVLDIPVGPYYKYLNKTIKDREGPKYLTYWTHFTDYQIGQFKTLAEYDYFVLGEGIETEGAPDFGLELDYPVKLVGKPFWVKWSTLEYQEFRLWTWIQGSIALERPLGEKTITWFNYFSTDTNFFFTK